LNAPHQDTQGESAPILFQDWLPRHFLKIFYLIFV
jgi:hypothetical protein